MPNFVPSNNPLYKEPIVWAGGEGQFQNTITQFRLLVHVTTFRVEVAVEEQDGRQNKP